MLILGPLGGFLLPVSDGAQMCQSRWRVWGFPALCGPSCGESRVCFLPGSKGSSVKKCARVWAALKTDGQVIPVLTIESCFYTQTLWKR
uniref:Secreted protein n=1 Tax=Anguilla anguilla TaxID=7936 RepID=A0A0E9PBG7_ANGAN